MKALLLLCLITPQNAQSSAEKKMVVVPIKRKSGFTSPITLTQQYLAEYHINSLIAEEAGEEYHPRHFSETKLDLIAEMDDVNEFDENNDDYPEAASLAEGPGHLLGISFVDLVN